MSAATATGYRLTLPTGWYRIPTGPDAEDASARVVDAIAGEYSDHDAVLLRRQWADALPRIVAAAEEAGALDLYLFVQRLRGRLVAMQFTVSVVFLGGTIEWTHEALEAAAVPDGAEHEFLTNDAGEVLRVVEHRDRTVAEAREGVARVFGVDPDFDAEAAEGPESARVVEAIRTAEADGVRTPYSRVSYLAALPDAGGAFLLLSTEVDDSALAPAQLAHVDLVASTLKWVR